VKEEHLRSKIELRVFHFAGQTLQKEQTTMTNQVGIDMNSESEGDDLLQYNPNRLLDTLIENLRLKNDAALSRALEVAPPVISKIRHHRLPVGASLLIRMHEVSDLSIRDLRYLMGDRRNKFRISDKQFKPKEGETPSKG
jgi:hypothetical protein